MKISYSQYQSLKIMSPEKFKELEKTYGFVNIWRIALNSKSAQPSSKEFFETYRSDIMSGNMKVPVYMPVNSFIESLNKWYTEDVYKMIKAIPLKEVFEKDSAFLLNVNGDDMLILGRIISSDVYEITLALQTGIGFAVRFREKDINEGTVELIDGFWDSPDKDKTSYIGQTIETFKLYLAFMKFADVEVEVIGKNTKTKSSIYGCKVRNEGDIDVILLDSRWFREIIRTDGFGVRGHLRLQPYKDVNGHWTRKLIWIEAFEKHGYHRKARMCG